jgi:hypothetical protein
MKDFKKYMYTVYGNAGYKKPEGNNCGLLFKAKYIDKNVFTIPSDSMKEGIFFEYLATGSLPKNGMIPEPDRTLKGVLTAAYERVTKAADFFKDIIEHHNIKLIETSYVLQTDIAIGTIDIWAEWNGEPCIIDLKYSGLINDKWSDIGWNTDSLSEKHSLMIQGVHYRYLSREALGLDVPFYYFIFNQKDATDMKIIRQEIDEDQFPQHEEDIKKTLVILQSELNKGFKAVPNYSNCKSCPLFDTCKEKEEYPTPVTVYYGDNRPSYALDSYIQTQINGEG